MFCLQLLFKIVIEENAIAVPTDIHMHIIRENLRITGIIGINIDSMNLSVLFEIISRKVIEFQFINNNQYLFIVKKLFISVQKSDYINIVDDSQGIREEIAKIIAILKKEYTPLKIILFGSYVYGNPTEDSDIDLLIIKNTNKNRVDRFITVKKLIYDPQRKIVVSPLVLTPDELSNRLSMGDDFIKDIISRGIVLYERKNS